MSEPLKYKCIGEMVQRSRCGGGDWVSILDYDDAQVELAALREELADCRFMLEANSKQVDRLIEEKSELRRDADEILKHRSEQRDDVQQRLTSAEQRNAELTKALERGKLWIGQFRTWIGDYGVIAEDHLMVIRTLKGLQHPPSEFDEKPTESGASE
jgi:hypothetical protein